MLKHQQGVKMRAVYLTPPSTLGGNWLCLSGVVFPPLPSSSLRFLSFFSHARISPASNEMATTRRPSEEALGLLELVSHISSFLDPPDLFSCVQVSRLWNK